MKSIEIKAPAKINAGLFITSKRDDGFHNIETIFYPVAGLYDTLSLKVADSFSFSTDSPGLSSDTGSNLVVKAARLFAARTGSENFISFRTHLIKRIPMGAGLGGGSSDAAAMLLALNELNGGIFDQAGLREMGLQLGSDVPFFIKPGPLFASGRGEIFEECRLRLDSSFILIVNPGIHISTPWAYKNCRPSHAPFDLRKLTSLRLKRKQYKTDTLNDFERIVFPEYPLIQRIKETMLQNGAYTANMSGSGSSVFGLFERKHTAVECSKKFDPAHVIYTGSLRNDYLT